MEGQTNDNAQSKSEAQKVLKISNKYTTEKLMMMLDKEKLEALEEEFEAHPEGIEHQKFVWLMKCAMNYNPDEKYDLVHGLCKLFAEIDINGDKKMEWREFTQYVIDAVMQNPVKKNEKGELPNQRDLLEQAHSQKFIRFGESQTLDRCVHEGNIQKATFYAGLDKILLVESKSHFLKLVTPDMKKRDIIDLYAKDIDLYNKNDLLEDSKKRAAGMRDDKYFVLSASYDERDQMLGCVCSNKTVQLFGTYGAHFKRIKVVYTSGVQYGIWYLDRHKVWITVSRAYEVKPKKDEKHFEHKFSLKLSKEPGKKPRIESDDKTKGPNYINDWSFNPVGPALSIFCSIEAHKGQIMDVVELRLPPAIATCSLDQTVKIWDLYSGTNLGTLEPKHLSGVRTLDYTPDFSGSIISVGHENYIKVWSPEVSLKQAYVGTLDGHNTAVMCAKFIQRSPYVISIDEKLNIRIWDIRTLACLQVISQDRKKFDCNGLCVLGAQRKFIIYGRRMILFDTAADKGPAKFVKPTEEVYPIMVGFNAYYKTFMVVTKIDVRVYDGKTGILEKVFSDLMPNSKTSEITAFCMDEKHRKFYLGDAAGHVKLFNASNGVFIKSVGEDEFGIPDNFVISGPKDRKKAKMDHTAEISGLYFVKSDQILVTASHDSTLNVYGEEDPEPTPRLRKLAGGHITSEITCLEYSEHLSLIASGSSNGSITLWDFEMSRIEGVCVFHSREILALKFLEPFPCMVSSSADSYICLWGVRGSDLQHRYSCFCCLINLQIQDLGQSSLTVISMQPFVMEQKGMALKEVSSLSEAELRKHYVNCLKGGDIEGQSSRSNTQKYSTGKTPRPAEQGISFLDSSKLVDIEPNKRKLRAFMVTGDEKGKLRIWDFTQILSHCGLQPVPNYKSQRPYYNPKRKEDVDVSFQASIIYRKAKPSIGSLVIAEKCLVLKQCEAHKDQITCISKIEKPLGFITSSLDKHVKVWSQTGELWGDLSIVGANPVIKWAFPFDWNEVREKDKANVLNVIREMEPGTSPEPDNIKFDDEVVVKVMKKWDQGVEIVPKRSLINAEMAEKRRKQAEKIGEKASTKVEEKEKPKKHKEEETGWDAPLARDIVALVDMYNESTVDKKAELLGSMDKLKDKLYTESQETLSQMYLAKARSLADVTKKELLPMVYAKNKKEDSKKHGATTVSSAMDPTKRTSMPPHVLSSVNRSNSRLSLMKFDKFGRMKYLDKLDVAKVSKGVPKTLSSSSSFAQQLLGRNMKHAPGEINREIRRAIVTLRMKKLSDIVNYKPTDNAVLQKQMSFMKSFSGSELPSILKKP